MQKIKLVKIIQIDLFQKIDNSIIKSLLGVIK